MQVARVLDTHIVGWQGLLLHLHADINLSSFGGTGAKGWLAVSDLQIVRLVARWRTPWRGRAEAQFQHLASKLRRRKQGSLHPHADNALQLELPSGERLLIAHDHRRIYELHCLQKSPPGDATMERFLQQFKSQDRSRPAPWLWQAFGISGYAPPFAHLARASLLPGAPCITLSARKDIFVLGAFSLADRLLRGTPLKDFALARLRLGSLPGHWSGEDHELAFQGTAPRRLFLPAAPFRFTIHYDEPANLIRWNLTTTRPLLRIWNP